MKAAPLFALAIVALFGLALALTPVAAAAELPNAPTSAPAASPQGNSGASGGPSVEILPDPRQWATDVFNQVLVNLLQGISNALRSVVNGVLNSSFNFISQTPPSASYQNSAVESLWNIVRAIANGALVLAALWAGFNVMARQQLGSEYHELAEVFSRLALGGLLVNTSLSWCQLAIDANNALCLVIGQANLPGWQNADAGTQVLAQVIAVLIYLVISLLLAIQMLMRLALVDVLLVAAPVALLCWVSPSTQSWARLWSNTFFSCVFTQFVQVIALKLGGTLMTNLPAVGANPGLLDIFLGVALLGLTLKIPALMRGQLGDGLGFARYFAYRQAARGLEGQAGKAAGGLPGSGGSSGARAAA